VAEQGVVMEFHSALQVATGINSELAWILEVLLNRMDQARIPVFQKPITKWVRHGEGTAGKN
jgi:hypothetical protein